MHMMKIFTVVRYNAQAFLPRLYDPEFATRDTQSRPMPPPTPTTIPATKPTIKFPRLFLLRRSTSELHYAHARLYEEWHDENFSA